MASRARIISMRTKRPWGTWSLAAIVLYAVAWWLWAHVLNDDAPPRARVELASAWRDSPFAAVRATDTPLAAPVPAQVGLPASSAVLATPTPLALQHGALTKADAAQLAEYAGMDAKLKPNSPVPEWVAERDLAAAVSSVDPNTTLANFACAEEFCRLDVQTASGMAQGDVAEAITAPLAGQGALMFRYPEDQPNRVVVYLLSPQSSGNAQAEPGVNPTKAAQ